jgi:hypothetical protein
MALGPPPAAVPPFPGARWQRLPFPFSQCEVDDGEVGLRSGSDKSSRCGGVWGAPRLLRLTAGANDRGECKKGCGCLLEGIPFCSINIFSFLSS